MEINQINLLIKGLLTDNLGPKFCPPARQVRFTAPRHSKNSALKTWRRPPRWTSPENMERISNKSNKGLSENVGLIFPMK